MKCCQKIFDFGRFATCGESLALDVVALKDGEYTLSVDFRGAVFEVKKNFLTGESLVFPLAELNENQYFIGRVYDPDGIQIKKTVDGNEYECFSFETVLKYVI